MKSRETRACTLQMRARAVGRWLGDAPGSSPSEGCFSQKWDRGTSDEDSRHCVLWAPRILHCLSGQSFALVNNDCIWATRGEANWQARWFFTRCSQVVSELAPNQFCRNYGMLRGPVGFSFDLESGCEGFVFHRGFSLQLSANTCWSTGN